MGDGSPYGERISFVVGRWWLVVRRLRRMETLILRSAFPHRGNSFVLSPL